MKLRSRLMLLVTVLACSILPVRAQGPPAGSVQTSKDDGFFRDWFNMVSETQAEQPHWITPVATTTPRLEQEFRYDIFWQQGNTGITTDNYGGAKGLEIIPARRVEVILLAPPAFVVHNNPKVKDGFGDWGFLLKFRIATGNEENGNYILTAFLQATAPTGQYKNGVTNAVITPTIAYGKGFGKFDLQGTCGAGLPTGNVAKIGRTLPWNNTFQYHLFRKVWPEVESNFTHFYSGPNDGRTQNFVTPGLLFGRFHLRGRVGLTVGGGFQVATTHFHTNNHNGIFTVRFPF